MGLAIGHGVKIVPRLTRGNGRGRLHAARQDKPSHGGKDRKSKSALNPHLAIPSSRFRRSALRFA
jgi:hypothetical protein